MSEKLNNLPIHETVKKPAAYREQLVGLTSLIAEELNRKMHGLLPNCSGMHFNADGRVNIYAFNRELGGSYSEETVEADLKEARKIEDGLLPDVNLETVQAYVKDKTRRQDLTIEEIKEELKEEAESRDGIIAEIAINAILNKVLSKKNLIVARTAKLDDLKHGIDTFIFDPVTGEIICGFDEVNYRDEEEEANKSFDRKAKKEGLDKKKAKILRIAGDGGARLKYAYRLAKDESGQKIVKQGSVENLPVLYLGISKSDLIKLLAGMDYNNADEVNEEEAEIFNLICASVGEQLEMLNKTENLSKPVRKNLNKLPDFLKKLKE